MQINDIGNDYFPLVEIVSGKVLVRTTQDALDLMGEVGFFNMVLYDHNFEPEFFDLSSGKLGQILQIFTNYRVKVAIVGNFKKYPSKVLGQFIFESNKVGNYLFVDDLEAIKQRWIEK